MRIKNLFNIAIISLLAILFHACSNETVSSSVNMTIPTGDLVLMPVVDWNASSKEIKNATSEVFLYRATQGNACFFEYKGEENITMSYLFNQSDQLIASSVMLLNNTENNVRLNNLLKGYSYYGNYNNYEKIYMNEQKGMTAMLGDVYGVNGTAYTSLIFSPYNSSEDEEIAEDDENLAYVDLGLSVKWAKCNVGASSVEKSGDFYAWSETKTKSSYWRENYVYCNNNSNKYIFAYTNPLANIKGTKYDVATQKLGAGWRMPTRDEALELIYGCTWEKEEINGVVCAKVTGPNGKSIYIPQTGYKKQNKDAAGTTHLWTSETESTSDEEAFAIYVAPKATTKAKLNTVWKAWGLPVRAVKE